MDGIACQQRLGLLISFTFTGFISRLIDVQQVQIVLFTLSHCSANIPFSFSVPAAAAKIKQKKVQTKSLSTVPFDSGHTRVQKKHLKTHKIPSLITDQTRFSTPTEVLIF